MYTYSAFNLLLSSCLHNHNQHSFSLSLSLSLSQVLSLLEVVYSLLSLLVVSALPPSLFQGGKRSLSRELFLSSPLVED